MEAVMVDHACNISTQEAKAWLLRDRGQLPLW